MHRMILRVLEALRRGEAIALASVVERRGSLPMATDACMLVDARGEASGTIGGGCLEAEVYAVATRLLRDGGASLDRFDLNEVEEGLGGHVCGGSVGVLTRALRPEGGTLAAFEALASAIEGGVSAALATVLPTEPSVTDLPVACCGPERRVAGHDVPDDVRARARDALAEGVERRFAVRGGERDWIVEPIHGRPRALVFGAGHCGRAIGRLAAEVGFRVTMLEDRAPFLDAAAMSWADELREVRFDALDPPAQSSPPPYVVIVTRGHEHDLTILRQVLGWRCAYLGMIGSERKRLLFQRTLRDEGVDDDALERLRSPMGLRIGADTPEEIGVAVVAEMIALRRRGAIDEALRSGRSSRRRSGAHA